MAVLFLPTAGLFLAVSGPPRGACYPDVHKSNAGAVVLADRGLAHFLIPVAKSGIVSLEGRNETRAGRVSADEIIFFCGRSL
jgi:hypothetical protein